MLTMDQIHNIKYQFKFKGKSLRSISKDTGHHFDTIKRYVEMTDFNLKPKPVNSRPFKLKPYTATIDAWLLADLNAKPKQRHTAKRVYDRLREIFPDFNVSDRSVRVYVSQKKKEIGLKSDGFLPLEHPPGEAQLDFGEAQFIDGGVLIDGYYLNMSFPFSNGGYLQIFKSANQECLLEGMRNIFEHVGRVPSPIWFDNMSTAVKKIRKYGERDITKGFERFMLHYGFQNNFCNPNSGHEKGHVENKVGYHRRNMLVPIPEFNSIISFNKQLLLLCDKDMNRGHYRTKEQICNLFQQDIEAMESLPKIAFEVYRLGSALADNYGKIHFEGKTYSSAPQYAKQSMWIKIAAHTLEILNHQYENIVKHERLYGAQMESMIWGPYLELMSRRPTALKYTGFFKALPTTIQDYFDCCDYTQKKEALKVLMEILNCSDMETAISTFRTSMDRDLKDSDSLLAIYKHLINPPFMEVPISLPNNLLEVSAYIIDSRIYDKLLPGGGSKWKQ